MPEAYPAPARARRCAGYTSPAPPRIAHATPTSTSAGFQLQYREARPIHDTSACRVQPFERGASRFLLVQSRTRWRFGFDSDAIEQIVQLTRTQLDTRGVGTLPLGNPKQISIEPFVEDTHSGAIEEENLHG